jgi:uncharacterized protein
VTDLEEYVHSAPLADTHEHLHGEAHFLEKRPDILQALFDHYTLHDLKTAGASPEALTALTDATNPDIAGRFRGVAPAWEAIRFTGYGEAVRLATRELYGLEEVTAEGLASVAGDHENLLAPGGRLRLLRDVAGLTHVQIDKFNWVVPTDPTSPTFFRYDINVIDLCSGKVEPERILNDTGVQVRNLDDVREAVAAIFARHAPAAIAVKSQHAYQRTLRWEERTDDDARGPLEKTLAGAELTEGERLALGDWCTARCVEAATRHGLPFKIHTGHYAGNGYLHTDRIAPGLLCGLLRAYPDARFVLMHIGYPYAHELLSVAKHFPNVWVDLCWAWSLDPLTASDFVRRFLHAAPANKLFAFGGDSFWPMIVVGYARQARKWLARSLRAEIASGDLTEREALAVAERWMTGNAAACFPAG